MYYTQAAKDLRRFIQQLDDEGELLKITKEVDLDLELAAIVRKVCEMGERATLFTNPKGREGDELFRILGASIGVSKRPGMELCRIAKSIGLPSSATGHDVIAKINEAKSKPPIPCQKLDSGPVKDHVIRGDDIDLTKLPVPLLHEHDGGKFIDTLGIHVVQKQDIGTIWNLWKEKGEDMPWALCFGVPPAAIVVGGMPIPKWTNEPEFIGALTGAPVDIVKCETNDLCVPANAGIVLEGVVSISETAPEGPMVEYNCLVFPGRPTQCPIFKVNTITYRHDPILPICVAGRAPDENSTIWSTMQAAVILDICQKAGLPLKMVWCPFESHCLWFVFQVDRSKLVEMHTSMEEFSRKVGHTVFGSKPGWSIPKIFLVGDYIDPTNLADVIWAEATRCEPDRHEFVFNEYSNTPLIPYVTYSLPSESGMNGKVVKCYMLPAEFTEETLPWKEGSFEGRLSGER